MNNFKAFNIYINNIIILREGYLICNYFNPYGFEPGRIIVALNKNCTYPKIPDCHNDPIFDGIETKSIETLFQSKNPASGNDIGAVVLLCLKCKEKSSVFEAIEMLMKNPCVVSAEPDYFIGTHKTPNDPYFRFLWGMEKIKSPLAWNFTTGSKTVIVGVLDSGVDYNHPDLVNNLYTALNEEGAIGWYSSINSLSPMDETGHGTHVAGTVGAVGNNFIGVTGVCWNVNLASLKIGGVVFNLAAAIKAIDFANMNNIPILNNSWGGRIYSTSLKFAIDNYDGLFIASAGNSSSDNDIFPVYPASFDSPNIISVASTSQNDTLSSFSNFGAASVDIAAPGTDILSTDLFGTYSYLSGTSMAAPHVAGAAALLKSFRPSLTALEIKDIILSSVDFTPSLSGRVLTSGILNIHRMIELAVARF